ncbi:MAG: hypothetical protein A2176_03760 [Spirochaetes bacterium RBG_13_51_14]|nr:MAG: hypothetical protein A2176_03760 [Spirochaetes bacterium RBG_13_51_14]
MNGLNSEQYYASRADTGVSLVLAGAGTGKTKTLVEKVTNVIRDLPLDPSALLVLTFSRRAAKELRLRIASGTGGREVFAGTFHSFCLDLLREHGAAFLHSSGFDGFPAVVDDEGRSKIIRGLIYPDLDRFLGMPAGVVYDLMNSLMNNRRALDGWKEKRLKESGLLDALRSLVGRYADIKRETNSIDYDDMMNFAISLLENDPAVRAEVLSRYRYLFVDEFQDVSGDNIRLLKLLLPETGGNLFAVGDDWQSIYGFRKAAVGHIIRMKRFFPGAVIHRLTINYRSRKEIVSLSNGFIKRNRFRTRKRLRSGKGKGGRVRSLVVSMFNEEAEAIRAVIAYRDPGMTCAVLCRNNWQCRYIRSRLYNSDVDEDGVSIMTMHASKGLEFDIVIVAGVCDSVIPDADNDIEEERRLLYVACTRAREELYIIAHANDRGQVSRFGRELGIINNN